MKRILLLSLVLVMALGALGVGYAAWTDSVTFSGNVTMGKVDVEIGLDVSGTTIYKDPGSGNKIIVRWQKVGDPPTTTYYIVINESTGEMRAADGNEIYYIQNGPWIKVAEAYAEKDTGNPELVNLYYVNVYPCSDYVADFKVCNKGNVPVKLYWDPLYLAGNFPSIPGATVKVYKILDNPLGVYDNLNAMQIDPNKCGQWVGVVIHIPQDNTIQGGTYTFTGKIVAVQWDKYGEGNWEDPAKNPN